MLAQLFQQQNFQHFNLTDRYTASNISEGKMALTYSELAANLSQHIKPTDRHWSTCTANISEGEMVLTHSVRTTLSRTSNPSTHLIGSHTSTCVTNLCERWYSILCVSTTLPTAEFPTLQPNSYAGTQVPVHPTSVELPTLQTNRLSHKHLCSLHLRREENSIII